ncbi:hypothetical protein V8E51_009581 [Hyaloscypha variabilis]
MAAGVQDANSVSAELSSKLWYEAKQNLSKEEQGYISNFQGSKDDNHGIVNDVLRTAKEKQKEAQDKNWTFKRSDGRVVVVRELFSKIVDWITKFQGAVDFLVSMDVSGHAALPWAGVKFLLSIAVKDSQKWGSVIAGIEFVTREISYYGIFEVIYLRRNFSATKQLSDALVQAYTKILQFLSGARRYYDQNSLKRFLGTAFSLDDNLSAIVTAIKTERDDIERLRGVIDGQQEKELGDGILTLTQDQKVNQDKLVGMLNDLTAPMEIMAMQLLDVKDKLGEISSEMQMRNKADQLPRIYDHLQPGKMTSYESKLGNLTPGTTTWILQNETFTHWIEGRTSVLFICGGPGTGKSHLSTKVIDYLRTTPLETSGRLSRVGYYYFKDSDKSTRSALTALCAIIYRLATDDEVYRMHATEICTRSPNFAMATCGTLWNDFLVSEFGATSDTQLFLVFDGIDEAEREEFAEFVGVFSRSDLPKLRIQLLLVGRPEMNFMIKDKLDKFPFSIIEVSSKVNIEDIRKFSQARYDEVIKVPRTLKRLRHTVTETLTEKADGMFLWVDLIYKEELQDILSPIKLKQALENLPEGGLTNLYDRIFMRIERDNGPAKHLVLQEVFSWAAYFKEPLTLFYLNEILESSIGKQYSDAQVILEQTCASLFVLVKTGELLLEESNQAETKTQEDRDTAQNLSRNNNGRDSSENEPEGNNHDVEDHDDDEDYDEERELVEWAEAEEVRRKHQRDTFVHLRHASLGDYLRRADLKPTAILLGAKKSEVHVVVAMLQIICKGADAPQELWLYLMANLLSQLGSLDCSIVSEADTKLIIRFLHELFTSETLARHIAKFHHTSEGYPLIEKENFSFGVNTDQQNENSIIIRRWLQKSQDTGLNRLDSEISKWVGEILSDASQLLVPLVKICINEWLECSGSGLELYWRFFFIWICILSTNLVPPVPKTKNPPEPLDVETPIFVGDDPFTFVAGLSKKQQTMQMHLSIAKTVSYVDPGNKVAVAEYQKAIELAREQESEGVLKTIWLEQMMAYFSSGCVIDAEEYAFKAIENYLKLDYSNAKVLTYSGIVHVKKHDYKKGIELFQKSLAINKEDHKVGMQLLFTLFQMKDYKGMISQIEYYGIPTLGSWLRNIHRLEDHKQIIHAARTAGKMDIIIECYQHEIENIQLTEDELQKAKDDDPVKTAQQTLRYRTRRVGMSSMFRIYLGGIYLEILGQPDKAFELWKIAFFQHSEFFNLGNLITSAYQDDIIPEYFARFSQLIYEKALDPDPELAGLMISHLEHLRLREKIFQQLNTFLVDNGLRNVNVLLARLYLRNGRKDEARKLLNDQFQCAMELLGYDLRWNYEFGFGALAALLFLNGQLENAEVALSLKRFFLLGFDSERKKRRENAPERTKNESDLNAAEPKDGRGEGEQTPTDTQDERALSVQLATTSPFARCATITSVMRLGRESFLYAVIAMSSSRPRRQAWRESRSRQLL